MLRISTMLTFSKAKTLRIYSRNVALLLQSVRHQHTDSESKPNEQNTLQKLIAQKIKATGPISVAQYMKDALINPAFGYYINRDVFGRSGDFITSPEISQLFGEMIAVWFANEWLKVGRPKPFNLIELGPGRGSMISDVLRVFARLKLLESMTLHLVEVSDTLSKLQAEKLCSTHEKPNIDANYYQRGKTATGVEIYWYRSYHDIRIEKFSLVVAHEFFDALPIHKFQKTSRGWCEVLVDLDPKNEQKFKYVLSSGPTVMSKLLVSNSETRDHVEVCPDSQVIMEKMASQLERFGGICLIIDYGHSGDKTDTFRAYRKHQQCDPLMYIGSTDLTADVDFNALKKVIEDKLISFGPVTQRQFLLQMQIEARLQMLLEKCSDREQREQLQLGFETLTSENKMGNAFHFVAFFPAVLKEHLERYPSVGFI